MTLSLLEVANFRNLTKVNIEFDDRLNVFYGENGSGKTSLLESIYYLSLGRSFRTHSPHKLIQCEKDFLTIFGVISGKRIGIERLATGETLIHLDQKKINTITELARVFPVQVVNPDSYELINSGPQARREFIDFGVFHVEHSFLEVWKKVKKILKHRNVLLRNKANTKQISFWDKEFAKMAHLLTEMREQYIKCFEPIFYSILKELLGIDNITIKFKCGWTCELDLKEVLDKSLEKDIQLGYTQYGPHKADLQILIENIRAQDILSRGQQKLLVFALQLAHARLMKEKTGKNVIFLIDDLPSELDANKREILCGMLLQLQTQIFITGIELAFFHDFFKNQKKKIYCLERGYIKEVNE